VDVVDVAEVSGAHPVSIFSVEDGRKLYLRIVGNIAHIHTV
jgi:hypothetical protein